MTENISIVRALSYDPAMIDDALEKAFCHLLGEAFSFQGERVFIKPNCLIESLPEKCELTHPEVIKSLCQMIERKGGVPVVCDSPAFGSLEKILLTLGIKTWLDEKGIEIIDLKKTKKLKDINNITKKPLVLSRDLLEARYVINAPKLKAHGQMKMSCAVKNMFGAVVGKRKALWHMCSKNDLFAFSELVVRVCYAVHPFLTVVDAISSLSEKGPRNGTPCLTGLLIAGRDPVEIDCLITKLLGIHPEEIMTNRMAREKGFGCFRLPNEWQEEIKSYSLDGFHLPRDLSPIVFRPLRVLRSVFRHLVAKLR
ncbi:MAG: DUF362 domain-containing protein [Candidatus Aureabacteria bacterium]|nr:DUF362 domain-containing protein [Candidatus Auribacterota bacterium]